MTNNTKRVYLVLTAALIGVTAVGCVSQAGNPDNVPGVPTATVNKTTSSSPLVGSFDDAASTWSQVEVARGELDTAIKAKKLDQVHVAAAKIRDLVRTLPDKSAMLSEEKRKTLGAHVKNVDELATMMDKSEDPGDMKSAEEHQAAMNDALDMMKAIYPESVVRPSMHMPGMNASAKGMGDVKMSYKTMPADTMSETEKPADPNKGMPDDKGGGMGMMDKMMPGMANDKMSADKSTMDKMTSGMAATDKNEMKMMIDKMAAMPPAERKKAMQKMSGMGEPTDTGKQNSPGAMRTPSGGGMGDM